MAANIFYKFDLQPMLERMQKDGRFFERQEIFLYEGLIFISDNKLDFINYTMSCLVDTKFYDNIEFKVHLNGDIIEIDAYQKASETEVAVILSEFCDILLDYLINKNQLYDIDYYSERRVYNVFLAQMLYKYSMLV